MSSLSLHHSCVDRFLRVWIIGVALNVGLLVPVQASELVLPGSMATPAVRMTVWGFDVYDAKLWARAGFSSAQYVRHPFALELSYLRGLKGDSIAQRSLDEMKRQGPISDSQAQSWLKAMQALFPDVQKGDRIVGVNKPEQGAEFWVNDRLVGQVTDPQFAKLFFGIWLSPQTSAPEVRQALISRWP